MNIIYDDIELLQKLKNDSRKAYEIIYKLYYNDICTFLLSFTNDTQVAEDIAQNIMLMLWEKRVKINLKSSLKKYLLKSAYNSFINHYRSNKKNREQLETLKFEVLHKVVLEEDDFKRRELIFSKLDKAIGELPPKCKQVFILGKIQGYKYKEISEKLNISIKTVENHMSKSFKLIKVKMKDDILLLFVNLIRSVRSFPFLKVRSIRS